VADCPLGEYWNELSCQCFVMLKCKISCSEGTELFPMDSCSCVATEEIKAKLYPDWATDEDILEANAAGFKNYKNPNGYWPICDEGLTCEEGF